MTQIERGILKKAHEQNQGLFSPVDMIAGCAGGDARSVERLVGQGYLERVPQDRGGGHRSTYSIIFYALTEKGIMEFASRYERMWFHFKHHIALYVGLGSIIFSILTLALSSLVSWYTVGNSLEANKINERIADVEYENSQPFLVIKGGNEQATDVRILNAGGGPAQSIFFLKHYLISGKTDAYALTHDKDIGLALAAGQEVGVNLNEKAMDHLESLEVLLSKVPCLPVSLLEDRRNWIIILYSNIRGENFVTKINGTGNLPYASAVDFMKLDCTVN